VHKRQRAPKLRGPFVIETYAERWALITGASSGIGAEFARRLAARGMHLVLVARREEPMQALAADMHTHHGTRTEIVCLDLSLPDHVERLKAEIAARGIEVELLVNNAGFGVVGDIESTDPKRVMQMIELNIAALTNLTYHFLAGMLQRQHGAIINVASVAGFQPVAYMGAYAASKAYVINFSEALWAEARDRGVTVMALCPGATRTAFFEYAGVPNWLKKHSAQSPGQVVKSALKGLEKRRSYWVPGWWNYWRTWLVRMAPRRMVVKQSMDYFRPQPPSKEDAKNSTGPAIITDDPTPQETAKRSPDRKTG
jgi:short-subunit dehydrogenase